MDACFVTKLPENPIGDACLAQLRKMNVCTKHIARGGERLGIYFAEKGASQRASNVVYDRAHSSIATAEPADFNWDEIFKDADWFHFTGITPAISDEAAKISLIACKKAKEMGVTISCDLNYRKKLWTKQEAQLAMTPIVKYVDVLIANEEDANDVFGITAGNDVTKGEVEKDAYKKVATELMAKFNNLKYVAITLRGSISANDNRWSAMLTNGKDFWFAKEYLIHIVDRVGGGDSFGAGLIYGLNHYEPARALEFAVAASCLKHTIEGDYNYSTVQEVLKLADGDGSGRVVR